MKRVVDSAGLRKTEQRLRVPVRMPRSAWLLVAFALGGAAMRVSASGTFSFEAERSSPPSTAVPCVSPPTVKEAPTSAPSAQPAGPSRKLRKPGGPRERVGCPPS